MYGWFLLQRATVEFGFYCNPNSKYIHFIKFLRVFVTIASARKICSCSNVVALSILNCLCGERDREKISCLAKYQNQLFSYKQPCWTNHTHTHTHTHLPFISSKSIKSGPWWSCKSSSLNTSTVINRWASLRSLRRRASKDLTKNDR